MGVTAIGPGELRSNPARDVSVVFREVLVNTEDYLIARRWSALYEALGGDIPDEELADALGAYVKLCHLGLTEGGMGLIDGFNACGLAECTPRARIAVTYYMGLLFIGVSFTNSKQVFGFRRSQTELQRLMAAGMAFAHYANMGPIRRRLCRRWRFFRWLWQPSTPLHVDTQGL